MYEKFEKQIDTILEKHKGVKKVELGVKDYEKFTTRLENLNKEIKKKAEKVVEMHKKIRPEKVEVQKKSLELGQIIE